jgi:hypothetical protein
MFSGNVFCKIRHILSENYGMSPHLDIPFMEVAPTKSDFENILQPT